MSIPVTMVGEIIAGESATIRQQLETLIKAINHNTFDIGALLSRVKNHKHYVAWGFNTFREYIDTLDIKPRKAQYLVRISDVMETVGIERSKYEPLGLAKLREITSLDPDGTWQNPDTKEDMCLKDFIIGFIDQAQTMPLEDVKLHVRTLKGFVGDDDLVWVNICVKRSVKQNIIDPAFELARRNLGSQGKDDDGNAVEYSDGACAEIVCVEYINTPGNNIIAEEA